MLASTVPSLGLVSPTAILAPTLCRALLHVVSWGRNTEGQCGIETVPVVTEPTTVLELDATPVRSVATGKLNSCAVLAGGDVLTWGCGKSGKLGHGGLDAVRTPSRVEALVDRAPIVQAALGDNHSVFLDADGVLWSCGENREGQCGVTDLASAERTTQEAQQERGMAFHEHFRVLQSVPDVATSFPPSSPFTAAALPTPGTPPASAPRPPIQLHQRSPLAHTLPTSPPHSSASLAHLPAPAHSAFPSASQWPSLAPPQHTTLTPPAPALSLESCLLRAGLRPGEPHLPVRLSTAPHPLLRSSMAACLTGPHQPALEVEQVTHVAASKAFTAAATAAGAVWTLGSITRSSAALPPSQLQGEVDAALCAHGGPVSLHAGDSFCAALTADGTAVVWGRLPAGIAPRHAAAGGPAPLVVAVPGLPPITHVAAGQHHLLLSDGTSIWAIGRWVSAAGRELGWAPACAPHLLLDALPSGVRKLAAGLQASAAVGIDGRLWMWGRLIDSHHADGLCRRTGGAAGLAAHEAVDWSWAGYGADRPTVVPGLEGVRDVAIGGWHVLAVLE